MFGNRVQVGPVEGETETIRKTFPVKPYCPVRVTVELPDSPDRAVILPGLNATVKSLTFTTTIVVRVREPLEPTTVTVKVAADVPVQERVEF